ncbi:xanthine dehydrogenase family protein molybdopterin-binding subunit [candidate division KSB1 bacterium]|nr:xanthine dehydrogenase family protein molybdopterin-binding subunit [candidate division KSB1 bacterium]
MKREYFAKRVKTVIEENYEYRVIDVLLPNQEAGPIAQDETLEVIGKPFTRIEAVEKVTGAAEYTTDVKMPGMLHGKLLRSSKARANLTNVDVSKAEAMNGVKAVYVLPKENVNYQGDIIAAVAADTEDIAEDAVNAIQVKYEDLKHEVNLDRAMRSSAAEIRDGGNVRQGRQSPLRGDVVQGFKDADKIIEGEYTTQIELHQPLEPHGCVVHWKSDEILIYESSQAVQNAQNSITRQLRREFPDEDISDTTVRVLCEHLGAGFGSKGSPSNFTHLAARLSKMTGNPVRMIANRYEESLDTGNRPSSLQKLKLGLKNDGTFTAIELEAYGSGGITSGSDRLITAVNEMYKCANVKTSTSSVSINGGNGKPTRGPGNVQSFFAFESLLDEAAYELGIDPLEMRKKNYADKSGGGTGRPYSSNGLLQCYDVGAEKIGWSRRNTTPGSGTGAIKSGIGVAALQWGGGGNPSAIIEVEIFKDGRVNIRNGSQDIGTGTRTIMVQVAAEEFGLNLEDISIQIGDSSYPTGIPSWGSNTAASVCPAVRNGAIDALEKLFPIVAERFNVTPDELESNKGMIRVKANPNVGMNFKAAAALMTGDKVTGEGRRGPNPREFSGNTFGAHFAEVEVDTETGKVKVIKVVGVHDSGRIINPLTARSQVIGGMNQSIGYGLLEERVMDNYTGRMTNPNMHDYKVLTAMDAPEIDVTFVDIIDTRNNLGMKGIGEPIRVGLPAAIANAVYNASGVRIRDLPITPDKILNALRLEGGS